MKKLLVAVAAVGVASVASAAHAGVIINPVSGTASSDSGAAFAIENTFNQTGLSSGFTSGVTDFDAYIATNPMHSLNATTEWFGANGTDSATIEYDLGGVFSIDAMALWNEESSGLGETSLSGSLNGTDFFLLTVFTPFDNPYADYGAQIFNFAATTLRYLRLESMGCPQLDPGGYQSCAIGEIAFRVAGDVSDVPVPAALPLMFAGLAGLGFASRRKRKTA